MSKIVVTGAGGQLGYELGKVAFEEVSDHNWVFTDVGEMDITDLVGVDTLFKHERPDVVVNCAAYTNVDAAESDKEAVFRINTSAPAMLAQVANRYEAALIHISTDFVFDGEKRTPYTETDTASPLSVYGESKLAGEKAVFEHGCRGAVIRTSWLYSQHGRNFVKAIISAASKNSEIRVVDDQWGNPTAAEGLARAIIAMIPHLVASQKPAELFHYSDSGVTNRSGFAEQIVKLAGLDCSVVAVASAQYPMIAQRPAYSALDSSKIIDHFGIVLTPWRDALAQVISRIDSF